jgi:anti-anti-sigma factor
MGKALQKFVSRQDELTWEATRQGDADVLRCAGAFSLVSHEQLDAFGKRAKASDAKRLVMDMREVAHMDSAGLGVIAMIIKHMMAGGRTLALVPSPQVRNLIVSTGLDKVLLLADSIPAALDARPDSPAA